MAKGFVKERCFVLLCIQLCSSIFWTQHQMKYKTSYNTIELRRVEDRTSLIFSLPANLKRRRRINYDSWHQKWSIWQEIKLARWQEWSKKLPERKEGSTLGILTFQGKYAHSIGEVKRKKEIHASIHQINLMRKPLHLFFPIHGLTRMQFIEKKFQIMKMPKRCLTKCLDQDFSSNYGCSVNYGALWTPATTAALTFGTTLVIYTRQHNAHFCLWRALNW